MTCLKCAMQYEMDIIVTGGAMEAYKIHLILMIVSDNRLVLCFYFYTPKSRDGKKIYLSGYRGDYQQWG